MLFRSGVCLRSELSVEFGSRRSPDEVCLQPLESRAKSGSCRSSDEAYRQLTLRTEPGSRRSPSGVCLQSELWAESGSRRSPNEVCLQPESGMTREG